MSKSKPPHHHKSSCWDERKICGQVQHVHLQSVCYEKPPNEHRLKCGIKPHEHTDACWEKYTICGE